MQRTKFEAKRAVKLLSVICSPPLNTTSFKLRILIFYKAVCVTSVL
jgi:hypothetical protein